MRGNMLRQFCVGWVIVGVSLPPPFPLFDFWVFFFTVAVFVSKYYYSSRLCERPPNQFNDIFIGMCVRLCVRVIGVQGSASQMWRYVAAEGQFTHVASGRTIAIVRDVSTTPGAPVSTSIG